MKATQAINAGEEAAPGPEHHRDHDDRDGEQRSDPVRLREHDAAADQRKEKARRDHGGRHPPGQDCADEDTQFFA